MTALTIVLGAEPICSTMLFPYVGLLVSFLQDVPAEDAGYSSGILVGLFMMGQVVSGKLWGWVSDNYGRKFPLISGLLASGIAMLLFGLSSNIYLCYVLRFLHGFFNGNTLVAKTMIADITDRTNEAKGFALVSITWGLGNLIGPSIGGYLYDPVNKSWLSWLHLDPQGFWAKYPGFLPSVVIFIYTMFALGACVFFLDETNKQRKRLRDTKPVRFILGLFGGNKPEVTITTADASTAAVQGSRYGDSGSEKTTVVAVVSDSTSPSNRVNTEAKEGKQPEEEEEAPPQVAAVSGKNKGRGVKLSPRKKISYKEALSDSIIRTITIFYMMLSASDIAYGETLPLWGIAKEEVGGLNLTSDQLGTLMLCYAFPSIIANVLFHNVCLLMPSYLVFWRISATVFGVCSLVAPFASVIGGRGGYWYILLLGMVRQTGSSWAYSLIHMLTAKAAPLGCVGAVYGISQSLASLVRCLVPFGAAPLFAWSIDGTHRFPFNYWLIFLLSAVPVLASTVMTLWVHIVRHDEDQPPIIEPATPYLPNGDDASDENEGGRASLYLSMASSFCTNPVNDTHVYMPDLEVNNTREHRRRAIARTQQLVESVSRQLKEDTRHTVEEPEESVPSVVPVRAG